MTVTQASLSDDLMAIVGREHVLTSDEIVKYQIDEMTPKAVVEPGGYEEVAAVMRFANERGLAVIPWGGGTKMHIGNVPRRYDVALRLWRLNQVIEHEPADLTVTCQAGTPLETLQAHLADSGQFVSVSAPSEGATLGGILGVDASGPARHTYGTLRDFTIGMRIVTADGRITRAGGKVVKNVAGYDLCKLYIGSLGTLGVIVEATFKVLPQPKKESGLVIVCDSVNTACAIATRCQQRGLSVRSFELLNWAATAGAGTNESGCVLLLDFAGEASAVMRSRRQIEEMPGGESIDGDVKVMSLAGRVVLGESALLCRVSLLPQAVTSFAAELQNFDSAAIVAWPTVGIVYVSWREPTGPEDLLTRLAGAVSRFGGTLLTVLCPAELKRRIDVFGDPPQSFDLMRRIKQEFDPKGTLSPGRFVGRL